MGRHGPWSDLKLYCNTLQGSRLSSRDCQLCWGVQGGWVGMALLCIMFLEISWGMDCVRPLQVFRGWTLGFACSLPWYFFQPEEALVLSIARLGPSNILLICKAYRLCQRLLSNAVIINEGFFHVIIHLFSFCVVMVLFSVHLFYILLLLIDTLKARWLNEHLVLLMHTTLYLFLLRKKCNKYNVKKSSCPGVGFFFFDTFILITFSIQSEHFNI